MGLSRIILLLGMLHVLLAKGTVPQTISAQLVVGTKIYTVYDAGHLSTKFDPDYSNSIDAQQLVYRGQSCTPPIQVTLTEADSNVPTTVQQIEVTNIGTQPYTLTYYQAYSTNEESDITPTLTAVGTVLNPNSVQSFTLTELCPQKLTNTNFWSPIEVQITYDDEIDLDFQFEFTCDPEHREANFDWSIVILIFCSFLCVAALARFSKIYSFTYVIKTESLDGDNIFQGFSLDFILLAIYLSLYFIVSILCIFVESLMKVLALIAMLVLGFAAAFFFIDEIFCYFSAKGQLLVRKLFWNVRVCDFVSLVLATALLCAYSFSGKAWEVSDLVSLAVMGSAVKLFKVKNMRDACFFLIPCAILDVIVATIVHYTQVESYNVLTLKYFNYPIELQVQLFNPQFEKKCAWISIISVVLPGFFIGYCYRVDKNMGGFIYTIMSLVGLAIGETIWLAIQSQNPHAWPQSIFTYGLLIGVPALWAKKRGEFRTLWFGTFYDTFLQRNYRLNSFFGDGTGTKPQHQGGETDLIQNNSNQLLINKSVFQGLAATKEDDLFDPLLKESSDYRQANSMIINSDL